MNLDIASLFPDLEALTPDGRWDMLQDWLAKNPEYGERIDEWSTQTVDQVFVSICDLAARKYGLPVIAVKAVLGIAVQTKIKRAIELLQACYRERAAYNNQPLEKEIKNVRAKRSIKSRSQKNHR